LSFDCEQTASANLRRIAAKIFCSERRAGVNSACFRDLSEGVHPMIKRALSLIFLVAAAVAAAAQSAPTQSASPQKPAGPPAAPHTTLKVGDPAPDFTLPSTIVGPDNKRVRYTLSDFKGKKNVVLAFYVFAFTGG